jgi:hypothetical protein
MELWELIISTCCEKTFREISMPGDANNTNKWLDTLGFTFQLAVPRFLLLLDTSIAFVNGSLYSYSFRPTISLVLT